MTYSDDQQEENISSPFPLPAPTHTEILRILGSYTKVFQQRQQDIDRALATFREQQRIWPNQVTKIIEKLLAMQDEVRACLEWLNEQRIHSYFHTHITMHSSSLVVLQLSLQYLEQDETTRLVLHLDVFKDICRENSNERINKHLSLQVRLRSYAKKLTELVNECTQLAQAVNSIGE